MSEIVRVLRVIEYVGDREDVEFIINESIQGQRTIKFKGKGTVVIKTATIGNFPEILEIKDKQNV